MRVTLEMDCVKCKGAFKGIVDSYFIYKYGMCIECLEKIDKDAIAKYNKIYDEYIDEEIDENFFEVINMTIRNV